MKLLLAKKWQRSEQDKHPFERINSRRAGKQIEQFNWRRHWSKKVAPHLQEELVQVSLDLGMSMLDPNWKSGDAPYQLGGIPSWLGRVVPGKLTWYQPWGRCHWISFFSMAIGVLNYPLLNWTFVSSEMHTVPVGYFGGDARVVMDILQFDCLTAEQSIALAKMSNGVTANEAEWQKVLDLFLAKILPQLRLVGIQKSGKSEEIIALIERFADKQVQSTEQRQGVPVK